MESLERTGDESNEDVFLQDDLGPTIAEHAKKCQSLFHEYLLMPNILEDPTIMDDQLARFTLWTSNMDIWGPLNVSLDYRLRFSPTAADIIHQLLDIICETLTSLVPLNGRAPHSTSRKRQRVSVPSVSEAIGRSSYETSDSESNAEPLEENTLKVTEIIGGTITRLFRLSNAVRKSAKANRARKIKDYNDEDANKAIEELRLYTSCYIDFRFPEAPETLRVALIEANAWRLRRLYYQWSHRRRINLSTQAPPTTQPTVQLPQMTGSPPAVHFEPEPPSKPRTNDAPIQFPVPATNATTARQTAAAAFYAKPTTEVPRTISLLVNNKLSFPPIPSNGQCIYCGVIIESKTSARSLLWQNHVIGDLEPFICVFSQCQGEDHRQGTGPLTFETSTAWSSHMQTAHGHAWECRAPSHNPIVFEEEIEYQEHCVAEHDVPEAHIRMLSRIAQRPVLDKVSHCPFGDDFQSSDKVVSNAIFSSEALQSHIAGHMKEIALLALQKLPSDADEYAQNVDSDQPLEDDGPAGRIGVLRQSMYSVLEDEGLDFQRDGSSIPRIIWPPTSTLFSILSSQVQKLLVKLKSATIKHEDFEGSFGFSHTNMIAEVLNSEAVTLLIAERGWCQPGTSRRLQYSDFNPDTADSFLPILAILLHINQEDHITYFIHEGISARVLPLCGVRLKGPEGDLEFYSHDSRGNRDRHYALSCLVSDISRENFEIYQYKVVAPRLLINKVSDDYFEARHEVFCERTILPWRRLTADEERAETSSAAIESGYPQVGRVRMDPRSHNFDEVVHKLRLSCDGFAVKILRKSGDQADLVRGENEVAQLRRFNAFRHEHLVMLLISFQIGDMYYFVFPYAERNLIDFWHQKRNEDTDDILWLVRQLRGISEAVSLIHMSPWEPGKYGRHGDIKPENILIYKRPHGEKEVMVLSDMGPTVHSDLSRSKVSPRITMTPTYRPPECDLDKDEISRSFDIWTLGCLFMETMVWYVGGVSAFWEFRQARRSCDIRGVWSSIYYEFKVVQTQDLTDEKRYTASVKEPVLQWFNKVRQHANSTQLVHDIIDLVEDDMLIVRRKAKDRITSSQLADRLNMIYDKCQRDDYIHVKTHHTRPQQETIRVDVELPSDILSGLSSGKFTAQTCSGNKTEPGIARSKLREL